MNYKVCIKINGKWVTVGNVKVNQWGNLSLGIMKKPEVLEHLKGDGWANFALFDAKDDKPKADSKPKQSPPLDDDTVPF